MKKESQKIRIGVIDYDMGNIMSVFNALNYLGYENLELVNSPKQIAESEILILPGVGAFSDAMDNLRERELIEPLNKHVVEKKPIIGICLGMQLFFEYSYEGKGSKGLGWFPGEVKRLELKDEYRVPHMGWDNIKVSETCNLFEDIKNDDDFYFVHSYHADCDPKFVIAECQYGISITAAIEKENLIAFQFHPEKSHLNGLKLLNNSIQKLCSNSNA